MNYPPNCAGSYAVHYETFSGSFQGLSGLNFSSGAIECGLSCTLWAFSWDRR